MTILSETWETLTDWPSDGMDRFAFIFIWLVVLVLASLIVYGILYLFDSLFLPIQQGYGVVEGKIFEASHYSTVYIYDANLKTSVPHTTFHPDSWHLNIKMGEREGTYYLSSEEYLKVKFGQNIFMTFKTGRLFNSSLYIKSISL